MLLPKTSRLASNQYVGASLCRQTHFPDKRAAKSLTATKKNEKHDPTGTAEGPTLS